MLTHQITLQAAIDFTKRFRERPGPDLPICETYEAASVLVLLNQPACTSLRLYLGRKENGQICSVLVGVDALGRDMLPAQLQDLPANDNGILLEDAFHCPPICPPASPLNQ